VCGASIWRSRYGEYRGVVRVPRRAFQRLLPERPTRERCVEAYYLQRTRLESIAERKPRRRPVDRGWERGDQRAGLALEARADVLTISRKPPQSTRLGIHVSAPRTSTFDRQVTDC
jgi:hypothetical protein